jgi:hypothetical protein
MLDKITSKQYNQKFQKLIQRMRKKTLLFANDTPEIQKERQKRALADFFYFKETYFPHYADKPSGDFHRDLHELSQLDEVIAAIAGPRKHGKTVDLGVIKPIWKALRGDIHFFIAVSANDDLATERTIAIKIEFQLNERLRNDFGHQIDHGQGADGDFIIQENVRFLALGWKQPIRGKIFGHYRPDYIFIDDFEDSKSINPRIARDKLAYVRGDCYGALPDRGGLIVWVGNNTNKHSALNYFKIVVEDKETETENLIFRTYKAIKDDGTLLWPEGFTHDQMAKLRSTMGYAEFEKHMQQNPIIEGVIFKGSWYKYFEKTNYKPSGKMITVCDPSLGHKKSDFQAIGTLEKVSAVRYRIVHMWLRRGTISNMIRQLYWIDQNLETQIWLETNFWQILLLDYIPPIAEEMGYLIPIFTYEEKDNKVLDIMKLQPHYERGHIEHYHPKDPDLIEYEEMLGYFDPELSGSNKIKDDGPDVIARAFKRFKIAAAGIGNGKVGLSLVSETFRRMP